MKNQDRPLHVDTSEWQAELALSVNANLIRLRHRSSGLELLRRPPSSEALSANPAVWGVPLLFPPNRIAGGRFRWGGRDYSLPLNEPEKGNHIHGLALGRPFTLANLEDTGAGTLVETAHEFGPEDPRFVGYPHEFRLGLNYLFQGDAVLQTVTLLNRGTSAMPFGLGFHTAFQAPATALVTTGPGYWEVDPMRRLPTGKLLPWPDGKDDGQVLTSAMPVACICPLRLRLVDGTPFLGAILDFPAERVKVVYEFDEQYRHCALWNDGGGKGFLCVEPMTWMTNAPNLALPPETSGLQALSPGETWQAKTTIKAQAL